MNRMISILLGCAAISGFTTFAYAEVSVENAWVRLPPPVADTAAGYLTLRNTGDHDVILERIETDVSEKAEIHAMEKHASMMHMVPVNNLLIPANDIINLKHGGMHLMLTGLNRELKQGEGVNLEFRFKNHPSIRSVVYVRDPRIEQKEDHKIYEQGMDLLEMKKASDAAILFQKAAREGSRLAQYQLGLLYARGDGIQRDFTQARVWLRKAAIQGHPKAQFHLGQMHLFGDGGAKDSIKATMWFWLATSLGDRFARDSLRVMTGKLSAQDLAKAEQDARVLWEKMPRDMKIKKGTVMH